MLSFHPQRHHQQKILCNIQTVLLHRSRPRFRRLIRQLVDRRPDRHSLSDLITGNVVHSLDIVPADLSAQRITLHHPNHKHYEHREYQIGRNNSPQGIQHKRRIITRVSRPDSGLPIARSTGLQALLMKLLHCLMIRRLERDVHTTRCRFFRGALFRGNPESGLSLGGAEPDGVAGEVHLWGDAERGQGSSVEGNDGLVLGGGNGVSGVVKHDGRGLVGWRGVCGLGL